MRKDKDLQDFILIKEKFNKKKGKIGARTIKMNLESAGIVMNLKKIRRIMKKYGLVCKIRRVNKSRVSLQKTLKTGMYQTYSIENLNNLFHIVMLLLILHT